MQSFFRPARRASYALIAASGLSALALTASRPVHLDAPSAASSSKRLSIYPELDPEIVLEETHSDLERQIGNVREQVTGLYGKSRDQVQDAVSRWIGVEEAVEHRVKSLKPADEDLTPGILYVGVAALAGSVFARTRSLPVRFLLPPTLLLISFPQFLPKTSSNLRVYFSSLEDHYAPSLGVQHDQLNKSVFDATVDARQKLKEARESSKVAVENALKKAEEWSGLKLSTASSEAGKRSK